MDRRRGPPQGHGQRLPPPSSAGPRMHKSAWHTVGAQMPPRPAPRFTRFVFALFSCPLPAQERSPLRRWWSSRMMPVGMSPVPGALTWALIGERGLLPLPLPPLPSPFAPLGLCRAVLCAGMLSPPGPPSPGLDRASLPVKAQLPWGAPDPDQVSPLPPPPICSNALSHTCGYLVGFVRMGRVCSAHRAAAPSPASCLEWNGRKKERKNE